MEDREQLTFWKQVQMQNRIQIKILETELLLNLGQIYWRFKLVWKILTNSPKFLFNRTFQIVNLYWHSCMAKVEVSIQALL
jgi:hypothetical protein